MRLIVLGDLHFSTYQNQAENAARDRFFEGFFRQVAAHKADLVIAIGDTTEGGFVDQLAYQTEIARQAGVDLVRILGNHDAYNLDKSEIARFFLGEHTSAGSPDLYTGFEAGPVRCLLLDTTRSKNPNWSGFVSDEQLAWLGQQIAAHNRGDLPYLVVIGHHPIFGTTDYSANRWYNIEDSRPIQAEFAKLERQPAFYLCGHNHSNSLAGPDAQGWYYVQVGAPLLCHSYGLFTFDEAGARFETVDIDLSDPAFRAASETIRLAQGEGFNGRPLAEMYGLDRDHRLVVPRR